MNIIAVEAELHLFNGEVNWAKPLRLAIRFADGSRLRLSIAGDGETLAVDRMPLEPVEMGEYGRTVIFDMTERLGVTLRGVLVGAPLAIRGPSGRLVGAALPREGEQALCIWVDGDEFHWGNEASLLRHHWLPGDEPRIDGELAL